MKHKKKPNSAKRAPPPDPQTYKNISISKMMMDRLYSYDGKNKVDVIALYFLYHSVSQWQKTYSIW